MECPNCGSHVAYDQQFCRDCGDALKASAQRRRIPRAFWGLSIAFAGILLALIGSMIDVRAVVMSGVIMSILGMFSIAAMSILNQGGKQSSPVQKHPSFLPKADTTNKLPAMSAMDHFPSVTEHTTKLLEQREPETNQRN